MGVEEIIKLVGNLGVPVVLLFWVVFKLDRFLTLLVDKLEIYNNELGEVGNALKEIVKLVEGK